MLPIKLEKRFIQVTTDFSGTIMRIEAGTFALSEFEIGDSIYKACPFLESTIEALPLKEVFLMDSMFITSGDSEYNVDVDLFKQDDSISVIIVNRTNVYQYVKQLNQNRNEISITKHQIDRQNKELVELRKIADHANEEKSRFLAIISHEIRNPLNSILGYGDMIATEVSDPVIKDYAKSLMMAGNNLKVIVSDILDLSRIEAGKLTLVLEPISIKEIIENRIKNYNIKRKDSTIKLRYSLSENLPSQVQGDAVRVAQILSNLISNSFKFTKEGSITIRAELVSEKKNSVLINLSVKDTGRGMTNDQVGKIFEEYEQTEINDNRVHGGAGLGLSIIKRLVKAMKGNVSVESEPNVGTTFNIQIPFKKVENDKKEDEKKQLNHDLTNLEVLYADDDELNHVIAAHILSKVGATITLVNDGLEALSALKKKKFDIVLLDIRMPNMSGEELMEKKELFSKQNSKTPILALTANTSEKDVNRYLDLGFKTVISKPYSSEQLIDAINSFSKS